jgi:hypothetical protein
MTLDGKQPQYYRSAEEMERAYGANCRIAPEYRRRLLTALPKRESASCMETVNVIAVLFFLRASELFVNYGAMYTNPTLIISISFFSSRSWYLISKGLHTVNNKNVNKSLGVS